MQVGEPVRPLPAAVGVVPAAGLARRLGSPPFSKEILEVYPDPAGVADGALPVCYRLLHGMHEAGVREALVVSRTDKADLRDRLGAGSPGTPDLQHLELPMSPSAAFSVATATRAAGVATIALGFPDVLWSADAAFRRLLDRLEAGADVALGLFPPAEDYPTVAVDVDALGRVRGFHERSARLEDPAWTLAVWRPGVSRFLERAVEARYGPGSESPEPKRSELGLTEVFARGLEAGFQIEGVLVSDRPFLDIGEPARLERALRAVRRG